MASATSITYWQHVAVRRVSNGAAPAPYAVVELDIDGHTLLLQHHTVADLEQLRDRLSEAIDQLPPGLPDEGHAGWDGLSAAVTGEVTA